VQGFGHHRLGVATKTVSNTLSTIFAKLGVTNRTQAALLARRVGLGTEQKQ
jgi:DNA-binding NarL/FixJ family response regulator